MSRTKEIVIAALALMSFALLLTLGCMDGDGATTADIQAVRAGCAIASAHPDHPVMATVFTSKKQRLGKGPIGAAMPGDPVSSLFCKPWGSGH